MSRGTGRRRPVRYRPKTGEAEARSSCLARRPTRPRAAAERQGTPMARRRRRTRPDASDQRLGELAQRGLAFIESLPDTDAGTPEAVQLTGTLLAHAGGYVQSIGFVMVDEVMASPAAVAGLLECFWRHVR